MSRRAVLTGAALFGVGAGVGAGIDRLTAGDSGSQPASSGAIAFHGAHQAGIATPAQRHLSFAAFDVTTPRRSRLRGLLREWTAAAAELTAGSPYGGPADPGEAVGIGASRLTLTFGFGPSLFAAGGRARFGLPVMPAQLEPLPPFAGDALDRASSGGDLCIQACADDPQVTFHAVHVLARVGGDATRLRWIQEGFQSTPATRGETLRNLIGFKDGTNNIRSDDAAALSSFVWASDPAWMAGGTYAVLRRIEIVFPGWDDLSLAEQERAIGRRKDSGAPLGARREHDPVNLAATDRHGNPMIPAEAHIRIASPDTNGGRRILRRGYNFARGITPGTVDRGGHQVGGGLFFIGFARDPRRQIIPLLTKVSSRDALSTFTVHTASAIFAIPPGVPPGGLIGEQLLS